MIVDMGTGQYSLSVNLDLPWSVCRRTEVKFHGTFTLFRVTLLENYFCFQRKTEKNGNILKSFTSDLKASLHCYCDPPSNQ